MWHKIGQKDDISFITTPAIAQQHQIKAVQWIVYWGRTKAPPDIITVLHVYMIPPCMIVLQRAKLHVDANDNYPFDISYEVNDGLEVLSEYLWNSWVSFGDYWNGKYLTVNYPLQRWIIFV